MSVFFEGDKVKVVGTEFDGYSAEVIQDQRFANDAEVPKDRIYVLLDGTNNPIPFSSDQLQNA